MPLRVRTMLLTLSALSLASLSLQCWRWRQEAQTILQESHAFSAEHLPALIADQQLLAGRLKSGGQDAGPLLNRFVRLDGGTPEEKAPEEQAPWDQDSLHSALRCPDSQGLFPTCITTIPPVDTSVLSALMPYGTWNMASSGAWQRYLQNHPQQNLSEIAFPAYIPWLSLARLRLLQGYTSGDLMPALQEVRHLAQLLWSTETLVGEMVAVKVLESERATYEAALKEGRIPEGAWKPFTGEELEALKRLGVAMAGVFMSERGVAEGLYEKVQVPLGECAGLSEALALLPLQRATYQKPWPGELKAQYPVERIEKVIESGRCQLPWAGSRWKDPSRDLDIVKGDSVAWAYHLPFLRQALVARLSTIAAPHWDRYGTAG